MARISMPLRLAVLLVRTNSATAQSATEEGTREISYSAPYYVKRSFLSFSPDELGNTTLDAMIMDG